jgi:hypothetical protein
MQALLDRVEDPPPRLLGGLGAEALLVLSRGHVRQHIHLTRCLV